ncbi:hypothetical protein Tco_1290001, partial [Tanacetum coccineum]
MSARTITGFLADVYAITADELRKININADEQVGSPICPNCISYDEDVPHIFFKCPLAIEVSRAVCRWWDVVWVPCGSYSEWLSWLLSIKMSSRIKSLFEGV